MSQLILFGTAGCHLCEEAEWIVQQGYGSGLELTKVDIAEDSETSDRYGIRIPVLRDMASGQELDWPFDLARVKAFVSDIQPR